MSQARTQQQTAQSRMETLLRTSLYIFDLDPHVTESQLFHIFNEVAPVVFVNRDCRDLSWLPLGFACVGYNTVQDVARALELLNFKQVNGKPIRLMSQYVEPSHPMSCYSRKEAIFIDNLDMSVDSAALFDIFSPFGLILSCKVLTYASGQSKGCGLVRFKFEDSAAGAIEHMNNMLLTGLLNNKQVFLAPFIPCHNKRFGESSDFTIVYVENIPSSMSDQDLANIFRASGSIRYAVVMRDRDGRSTCFGFVSFNHADAAARAVKLLNGFQIDSETEWYVGRAETISYREAERIRAKLKRSGPRRRIEYGPSVLFIQGLESTTDEDKLRELSKFGHITSCKVMRDELGRSRRSGLVGFSTPHEADFAVSSMFQRVIGRGNGLYVAQVENEEERRRIVMFPQVAEIEFTQPRPPFHLDPLDIPSMDVTVVPGVVYNNSVPQPPSAMTPLTPEEKQAAIGEEELYRTITNQIVKLPSHLF